MIAYYNGQYLPKDEISISPDDRGFVFGDGAYEVVYSYNGRVFEMDAHLVRMARSLSELRITGEAVTQLETVTENLIRPSRPYMDGASFPCSVLPCLLCERAQ